MIPTRRTRPEVARDRYRTVGRTSTNKEPGRYRCVVRTDEGAVLSHAEVEITG